MFVSCTKVFYRVVKTITTRFHFNFKVFIILMNQIIKFWNGFLCFTIFVFLLFPVTQWSESYWIILNRCFRQDLILHSETLIIFTGKLLIIASVKKIGVMCRQNSATTEIYTAGGMRKPNFVRSRINAKLVVRRLSGCYSVEIFLTVNF